MTESKCTYDPLVELMKYYASAEAVAKDRSGDESSSLEDKLKRRIVDGDKIGIDSDLKKAMEKYTPLQIINEILLDGMKTVGDLFGSGQMQLPFVLQSAETMKAAVKYLEQFMERVEGMQKGVIVLATVKGDVHDIGKNLVDIILTNNGYKVINLGIKVPLEQIIEASETNKADAVGMSGLLVKSTVVMKENLEQMDQRGLKLPVVLGGAALTRRYVEQDLRKVYSGYLSYANDAFDGLHFMEDVKSGKINNQIRKEVTMTSTSIEESKGQEQNSSMQADAADEGRVEAPARGKVSPAPVVPVAPFYGSTIVSDMKVEKVWEYLNEVALIRGQWQFSKRGWDEEEYARMLQKNVYPILEEVKLRVKRESLLAPRVIYGYYPCQSDGDDLIIYRPAADDDLHSKWVTLKPGMSPDGQMKEWVRFTFPRQTDDRHLCISDFFKPKDSGAFDVIEMQAVTIGSKISEYTRRLFEDADYRDYLFLHGLSVESAEALAEYWHKIVRTELGIDGSDAKEVKKLFSQKYQGARFSFGYPACPSLEDQVKLFEILRPERIGISLTEEFQLVPEQSTTSIVVHHPEAKYFNVK